MTLANELTIDAPLFAKLFITDHSGFFAVGLLIYQHFRGRRGAQFWCLFALAMGTAIFQAAYRLGGFAAFSNSTHDPRVVAAICVISLFGMFLATRIKRVSLPSRGSPNLRSGSDGLHPESGSPFDKRQALARSFADIRAVSR